MNLDARELQDLAGFFSRRLPEHSARELAERAGVPLSDHGGFTALITEAARLQRLPQVVDAARRARPDDPAFARLGEIVGRPRRLPVTALALGLVALGLIGAATLWPEQAPVASPEPVAAVAAPSPEAPPAQPSPALPSPVEPAPVTPTEAPVSTAPSPEAAVSSGPCPGTTGEILGYFYAGSAAPGRLGETITLSQGARVRADYPGVHNRHDASAPVRCVLPPGSRVRLDAEPLRVPGEAFWVPLVGGSASYSAG